MKPLNNLLFLLILISNLVSSQNKSSNDPLYEQAQSIHKAVITIDTHDDIDVSNFTGDKNYTQELSNQVNIPKMEKGGLDVAWFIVYTRQDSLNTAGYAKAYDNAMSKFTAIHNLVKTYAPDKIELALNSADVKRIHASGKKVAMIGVENAYPLGTDLKNIKKFYDLGARYMSLAHQGHSQFSDSNTGEKENIWLYNNGLSELGKEAVIEMNKQGIMIDVSHPSKGAFMDIIKLTKAPIIASHSSARALCNHSRNLDDEQLKLIKTNGGVVQTVAFAAYVNTEKNDAYYNSLNEIYNVVGKEFDFKIVDWKTRSQWTQEERDAYEATFIKVKLESKPLTEQAELTAPPVNVSDFVDHIDYMVNLIGINHVGISSDFDGGGGINGWKDASETFNITY
ncbi:MAG: dipeptidase, partial [Flavobacteriaceae bacterium]|nr:dipeptidase [Flavobacteriaceae bacterium]